MYLKQKNKLIFVVNQGVFGNGIKLPLIFNVSIKNQYKKCQFV